jgi:hypothetical protein
MSTLSERSREVCVKGRDHRQSPVIHRGDGIEVRQATRLENWASDAGDSIVFDVGIRLPKAPDFDPGGVTGDEFRAAPGIPFCIGAGGRVVSYGR